MNKYVQQVFPALLLGAFVASVAYAQSNQTMPSGGMPPALPQSSIAACEGKVEGATCAVGNETGTCSYTPDKQYFACKPSRQGRAPGGNNGGGRPPAPPDGNGGGPGGPGGPGGGQ